MIDVNRIRATLQDRLNDLNVQERAEHDRDDYYVLSGQIQGIEDAIGIIDNEIAIERMDMLDRERNRNR